MLRRIDRGALPKALGAEEAIFDELTNGSRLRLKTPFVEMFENVFRASFKLFRPNDGFSGYYSLFVQLGTQQAEQRRYKHDLCQWNLWLDAGYKPDNCATGLVGH